MEKNDFSILKEEISQNNVLTMAELIAMSETRFLIGYMGNTMQKMHADLYVDILHKNDLGYVFSDSYDLVQEGALYLCEHYGKHLNDVVSYSKKGKARGDPRGDLGHQAPEAGGIAEPPARGHRHHRRVLYHPCGRLQGCVPSARGEATPVHSRRLCHRYRGRDHRLQPRHGAVPHSK